MSIIQAKGTRGNGKPEAPSHELYEDKTANRVSHIPMYIGASLGALILYLKNSLVGHAEPGESAGAEEAHVPKVHATQDHLQTAATEIGDAELKKFDVPADATASTDQPPRLHPQGGALFPWWNAKLIGGYTDVQFDSLDLSFKAPTNFNSQGPNFASPFAGFSNNDNRLGGAAGGGGGTGSPAPSAPNSGGSPASGTGTGGDGGTTPPTATKPTTPTTPPTTPPTPTPANRAPVVTGAVNLPDAFIYDTIAILAADLLKNAVDPDGNKLSVTDVKINGQALTLSGDHYVYSGSDLGFVTVTYNVTDGIASVADTAVIDFIPRPPILGTDGKDNLIGTDHGDNISGGGGDDKITGNGGDDVIYGGSGDDCVTGDAGNDVIYGGDGNDKLYGGAGNDTIFGGNGDDTIYGDGGSNFLFGGSGNDIIYAGDGNDTVFGGSGRDWIFDGAGSDKVFGGIGNDTVFAKADGSKDYFDGGEGVNKLSYASVTTGLIIDMNNGVATSTGTGPGIGVDNFTNFQVIEGGSGGTVFLAKVVPVPTPATPPTAPEGSANADQHHDDAASCPTIPVVNTGDDNSAPVSASEGHHLSDAVIVLPDAAVNQGYTYLGGASVDTLDYSPAQQALTIDVVHGMAHGKEIGTDYFSSIERFVTGAGDDTFVGAGQGTAHHMGVTDAPDVPDASQGPVIASTGPGNSNLLILDDASGDKVSGAAANQFFDGGAGFNTLNYAQAKQGLDINVSAGKANGAEIGHDTFANIEHFIGGSGADHFTVGSGSFVLEGHGGGDTFTFDAPVDSSTANVEIRGFEVGDLIQMSKYDIFEQPAKAEDDQFNTVYAAQDDAKDPNVQDAVAPIRVRHETTHDIQSTLVDGNIDADGVYHTTIEFDGNHHFVINNHIA